MRNIVTVTGYVNVRVVDSDGNEKYSSLIKNTETIIGRSRVAELIGGLSTSPFKYIGIGVGDISQHPPSPGDTSLVEEVARKEATVSKRNTYSDGDTVVLEAVFSNADGLSGVKTISEAGVFNASSGGDMFARAPMNNILVNFDGGDVLYVSWSIIVG